MYVPILHGLIQNDVVMPLARFRDNTMERREANLLGFLVLLSVLHSLGLLFH